MATSEDEAALEVARAEALALLREARRVAVDAFGERQVSDIPRLVTDVAAIMVSLRQHRQADIPKNED